MPDAPGLAIVATLLTGRYEAAGAHDRDVAEWPPHPARLFCALVASARTNEERAALRQLETLPPPTVMAAREATTVVRRAYVVTNRIEAKGGNLTHPGRTNQLRTRPTAYPESATVCFVWPASSLPEPTAKLLDDLARRVPYLGRSTGVACISAHISSIELLSTDGLERFLPCELSESTYSLRVPYPGYLEDLQALYDAGRPAWEIARSVGYRIETQPAARPVPSVYTEFMLLRFDGIRPDGRQVATFTQALRRAVMSRVGATLPPGMDLPEVLHGHGVDGRPHVAFLGVPNVGALHADGHLLGMAVAIPDIAPSERDAIFRGLVTRRDVDANDSEVEDGTSSLQLTVPGFRKPARLVYAPGLIRPWGLQPERWRDGSRRWVSATPVVLDRYPKSGDDRAEVLRSCRMIGLPDPISITTSNEPLASGAVKLRPSDLPPKARGRLYRHVALEFDRQVNGPLMLGAGRYLGLGLFAPERVLATTGAS